MLPYPFQLSPIIGGILTFLLSTFAGFWSLRIRNPRQYNPLFNDPEAPSDTILSNIHIVSSRTGTFSLLVEKTTPQCPLPFLPSSLLTPLSTGRVLGKGFQVEMAQIGRLYFFFYLFLGAIFTGISFYDGPSLLGYFRVSSLILMYIFYRWSCAKPTLRNQPRESRGVSAENFPLYSTLRMLLVASRWHSLMSPLILFSLIYSYPSLSSVIFWANFYFEALLSGKTLESVIQFVRLKNILKTHVTSNRKLYLVRYIKSILRFCIRGQLPVSNLSIVVSESSNSEEHDPVPLSSSPFIVLSHFVHIFFFFAQLYVIPTMLH